MSEWDDYEGKLGSSGHWFRVWLCFFHWRRQWHPSPVLLPGKSHGQRSLVGCSPWGREESDTTERLDFHVSLSCIGEGHGNPLQCSCLENPRDGGPWWAAVYGVAQSRTWLKCLAVCFFHTEDVLVSSFLKDWGLQTWFSSEGEGRGQVEGHLNPASKETHEKMFNIANYYRNTSQNCNEISPHTSQNGYHQKFTNSKHWRGCGEKGTLLHCWWECKLVQPLWRTAWSFLKNLNIELLYDAAIPPWECIRRKP